MNTSSPHHTALSLPNGWYAVAWSNELAAGEVKPIRYFGEDLVLFRTRGGVARVLDAFCPHLGAHLGEGGRVVGEGIRCPFHGWRYDGESGACVEIPYCERIPEKARVRAWHVVECNRMVFAWYHAEGEPPLWDVPVMPEVGDPAWAEPRQFALEVPVHLQDMAENNCDPVHFQHVHGMLELPPSKIEFGADGRFFRITDKVVRPLPDGEVFETQLVRDTWQIGISTVRTEGIPNAGLLLFTSTSPIDAENTITRWLFCVTSNMVDIAGEEWIQSMQTGVLQDMRIWKNKIYRGEPVLCEADTYLGHFRRWTRQFYSDQTANG